jgi:hypothetical protein
VQGENIRISGCLQGCDFSAAQPMHMKEPENLAVKVVSGRIIVASLLQCRVATALVIT